MSELRDGSKRKFIKNKYLLYPHDVNIPRFCCKSSSVDENIALGASSQHTEARDGKPGVQIEK